tara:strand:- start:15250 stop:15429 length:180 start_codon:yes stop_codon:yes gene_type:complete
VDALIIGIGIFICFASFIAYIVVSIYAPEWLGISSKKSEETEKKQETNTSERPKDFFSS